MWRHGLPGTGSLKRILFQWEWPRRSIYERLVALKEMEHRRAPASSFSSLGSDRSWASAALRAIVGTPQGLETASTRSSCT